MVVAIVPRQGVAQDLRSDVAQVMQSDHRGCQGSKRIPPANPATPVQGVRQFSPILISAMTVVSIHGRLLWAARLNLALDYTALLEL
jgi:hypothetical protein